jgi:hypothetical protein
MLEPVKRWWGQYEGTTAKVRDVVAASLLLGVLVVVSVFVKAEVAESYKESQAIQREMNRPKPKQMLDPSGRLVDKPVGNL